jgi:hypothetical protein
MEGFNNVLAPFLIVAGLLVANPALAQSVACTQHESALQHFLGKYQERPVANGKANNGWIVQILASQDGRTWTLMFVRPSGIACLMATGQDWTTIGQSHEKVPEIAH